MPNDTSPPRVAVGPDLDEGTVVLELLIPEVPWASRATVLSPDEAVNVATGLVAAAARADAQVSAPTDWTCIVCGRRHPIDHEGLLVAGSWMACCGCELVLKARRLDAGRPPAPTAASPARFVHGTGEPGEEWGCFCGMEFPTRAAAVAAASVCYAPGVRFETARAVDAHYDSVELPDVDYDELIREGAQQMPGEWGDSFRTIAEDHVGDLEQRFAQAWEQWVDAHGVAVYSSIADREDHVVPELDAPVPPPEAA